MVVPSTCTTPFALVVAFAMDNVVPEIDRGALAVYAPPIVTSDPLGAFATHASRVAFVRK